MSPGPASPKKRVLLATRNAGKVREMRERLARVGVEVETLDAYPDAPEVEETGTTFEENARLKALQTAGATGRWVIAEDSGLCVDALGGAPGIHSARFSGVHGDDAANNEKLLRELAGASRRTAHYACVIALARPDGEVLLTSHGRCDGQIADEPRGKGGFGYDPLFIADRLAPDTMAEVKPEQKQRVSHRAAALRSFLSPFEALIDQIDV